MTIFNIVRNQYFFLGEEILSAMPMAAIKLVSALLLIEMAEPGSEGRTGRWLMPLQVPTLGPSRGCDVSCLAAGLCTGLLGTIYNASTPFGTAVSNQHLGSKTVH